MTENEVCGMDRDDVSLRARIVQSGAERLAIYGAGAYAARLLFYLEVVELKERVDFIIVSEAGGNPGEIRGIPVKPLDEAAGSLRGKMILVAMKEEAAEGVRERLRGCDTGLVMTVSERQVKQIPMDIFRYYQGKPLDANKVLFYCYDGQGYKCNCKYIAEKLLEQEKPPKIVWAVTSEEQARFPRGVRVVRPGTKEYLDEIYTCGVFVSNCGRDMGIIKRKGQYCVNTWHGYGPFKKVEASLETVTAERKEQLRKETAYYDLYLSGSRFYSGIYREAFLYFGEVLECGAPRNDILFRENGEIVEKVYDCFNIPRDRKILLYAPTFRKDKQKAFEKYDLDMAKVRKALSDRFGGRYVLVYRFHHQLYEMEQCGRYEQEGYNATFYDDVQELLAAADVVITDYSSLMWDFSLRGKPVFLYQNDLEEYEDERSFYCPVGQWPYPRARTQERLIEAVLGFDEEKYAKELGGFLKKYGSCDDGHASEKVVERILEKMGTLAEQQAKMEGNGNGVEL